MLLTIVIKLGRATALHLDIKLLLNHLDGPVEVHHGKNIPVTHAQEEDLGATISIMSAVNTHEECKQQQHMDDLGEQEHNLLSSINSLEVDTILDQGNTIDNIVAYQQEDDEIKSVRDIG